MKTLIATALLAASLAAPATSLPAASPASASAARPLATTTDGCLTSVPDPGTTAPVEICYTIFRPAGR